MKSVIKIGTSSITYENGKLNLKRINELCRVVSDLRNRGEEIIIVSSGAIGAGIGKLNIERPKTLAGKQAIAAIGQAYLMEMYQKIFIQYNTHVAQLLLTKDVVDNKIKKGNVIRTFEELLSLEVVPIVNENDTVSTDEIKGEYFSDNDHLSSIVANLLDCERLIIMSNIDGLYGEEGSLIEEVDHIDEAFKYINDSKSALGTGGMYSKLLAVKNVVDQGMDAYIVNSNNPESLYDLFDGHHRGTYFRGNTYGRNREKSS